MNALVSAGGGTRAGAYARLWQGAGACRLGRVGGVDLWGLYVMNALVHL